MDVPLRMHLCIHACKELSSVSSSSETYHTDQHGWCCMRATQESTDPAAVSNSGKQSHSLASCYLRLITCPDSLGLSAASFSQTICEQIGNLLEVSLPLQYTMFLYAVHAAIRSSASKYRSEDGPGNTIRLVMVTSSAQLSAKCPCMNGQARRIERYAPGHLTPRTN